MAKQQYSTPDGSIWEAVKDRLNDNVVFDRVNSPDGSHEEDYRPQKLDEVLASWGPLSLYDPLLTQKWVVKETLSDMGWGEREDIDIQAAHFVTSLDSLGYAIRPKREDS